MVGGLDRVTLASSQTYRRYSALVTEATATASRGHSIRHSVSEFILGPRFARRLVVAHAIDDFGDALINLSLVGSLFLSVSVNASRNRVLLYLLLAAAPLLIVAPIVGNVLDRTRYGYSLAISGSQILRAAVSLALIGSLLTVALYPLTFLVLVSRKIYALAKTALLTQMTDDPQQFLRSDAHIARTGTVVGGIGTMVGGVLLATDHVEIMLLIAAPAFMIAAAVSRTLPKPAPPVQSRSAPRLSEAIPARIWAATLAVTGVRAAGGALTYLLAFAIKRGGGDTWIFAAGLIAAGAGGLLANLLAPRIHRAVDPEWVIVASLLIPGVICAIGVVTIGNIGVLAIAFSIGVGRGVGTRAITILNATVPLLARARSIARSELLFQVASLTGAILAVQLAPTPSAGFAVSSVVLIGAAVAFGFRQRRALAQQAARRLLGEQAPATDRSLPEALLLEAQRLATLGAYRMAIVLSTVAVDVLVEREPDALKLPAYRQWDAMHSQLKSARATDEQPGEHFVVEVLAAAEAMLGTRDPIGWHATLI